MRVIISGGGSGGHIFPAIAIADEIKKNKPEAEILFVGASGKMEMEKVPKAGYPIEGLPIRGLQRKLTLKNLTFPFRLIISLWKARSILKRFNPDVVVGVGGYASGPVLKMASALGIKSLVQEQNSYPGITNKLLAKGANKICVAYPKMERFFPKEKIILAGNQVRESILNKTDSLESSKKHFGLTDSKQTILLVGGSLGARTLNIAMRDAFDLIEKRKDVQWIWQAGKLYIEEYENCETAKLPNVKIMAFIDRMDLAYKAADLALTRAGALSISEIALVGQSSILIPSPNVAEDHQTKNANSLVENNAAILVKDKKAKTELINTALTLIDDKVKLSDLSKNILKMAKPNASKQIVKEIIELCI